MASSRCVPLTRCACLTVASCPRAWAHDPAHQTPAPQPPPPHPRKPHPRGSRTSHGVATHTHPTPQGRHWRQPSSRTRRPLRATRPQSPHHRRRQARCQWGEPKPASAAHTHKLLNQATVPKHHPRSATREVEAPGPSGSGHTLPGSRRRSASRAATGLPEPGCSVGAVVQLADAWIYFQAVRG